MRVPAPSFDRRNKKSPGLRKGWQGAAMATNKKKIFITESMSQSGAAQFKDRDDIELIEFPNMIAAVDFEAMLKQQAPVHGVALGGTRFGEPELEAYGHMSGVRTLGAVSGR